MTANVERILSAFCRLCLNKIENTPISLFTQYTTFSPSEIVQQHFNIQVTDNGLESAYVCQSCWSTTEQFHQLYTTVHQTENNLLLLVCNNDDTLPELVLAPSDIKVEDADDTPKPEPKPEPGPSSEPTTPPILTAPYSPTSPITTIPDLFAPDERPPDASDDVLQLKIENSFSIEYDRYGQAFDSEPTSPESSCDSDDENGPNRIKPAQQPVFRKAFQRHSVAELAEQNSRIRDFFQMHCDLCNARFEELRDAVTHYRVEHKVPGYIKCCGKKFFNRTLALDHMEQHRDPNAFRCQSCDRTYISQAALNLHLASHDAKTHKPYKCAVCAVEFIKYFQLTQHQRQKHYVSTVKSFGCDMCGKYFHTKWQLSTHIHSVHISKHICHTCAATFKSKSQLTMHHQRVHSGEAKQKVQCSQCAAWLADERSLRKHQDRHEQAEVACKLCNKMTPNRYALSSHMRYVHSTRNFACQMCSKTFRRAIGLREHLASHTGVDLYTCSYCPRTFKSNSNMFAHRKKAHHTEWNRDRELRNHS